ncbi:LysR substrate-binding domain-containing protein, partial [Mycobacterium tuberculosis]
STSTAATSRRSNSRLPTTLNARDQPPAEVSDQRVSGLTGAVQVVSARELAQTPLVTREPNSGIRDSLTAALRDTLGEDMQQAPPVLELSSAAAVRAAVLAGAGPAAMSRLAIADDLAFGRLLAVDIPALNLRRQLRAIWVGGRTPPAGAIRDLLSHITSRST